MSWLGAKGKDSWRPICCCCFAMGDVYDDMVARRPLG
jgi:hypothetical protein